MSRINKPQASSSQGAGLLHRQSHSTRKTVQETKKKISFTNVCDLPRASRRIPSGTYHVTDRRHRRVLSLQASLYHNTHFRPRFTSGTIIGWYTHPALWTEWARRPVPGYKNLKRKTNFLDEETKDAYWRLREEREGSDGTVLTEIEQKELRRRWEGMRRVARDGLGQEGEEEAQVGGELRAILDALGNAPGTAAGTSVPSPVERTGRHAETGVHPDRLARMREV